MQIDFDAIIEWTYRNNLRLNHSKTKGMILGSRNKLSKLSRPTAFNMCGQDISFVNNHSYLGVIIDSNMSLSYLLKDINKRLSNKMFMLRKIRNFLTIDAAITVYKQTILPIVDYSGFMLLACNNDQRGDLQKMKNDMLRICCMIRLSDRVSIPELHKKCKIISLEQRMRKQLLWLMFILSRDESFLKVANRVTRNADKITTSYQKSPYYLGTKLWNELSKTVQNAPDVYAFKKEINRMNRSYVKLV